MKEVAENSFCKYIFAIFLLDKGHWAENLQKHIVMCPLIEHPSPSLFYFKL